MTQIQQLPKMVFELFRSPVVFAKTPRRFTWSAALALQLGIGTLTGAFAGHAQTPAWGALLFCGLYAAASAGMTLFIFCFFAFVKKISVDIRQLYALCLIAHLPFFLCHSVSVFLPPIDLLGYASVSVLMTVGLIEQFSLPRGSVLKFTLGLFIAYFALWSSFQLMSTG